MFAHSKRKLLLALFIALLANWIIIVLTTRINDVPLTAEMGLLSVLPVNFIVALFTLPALVILSIYWKENIFAILFSSIFVIYFMGTPWLVEPLRIPDSLFHFSRVVVVNDTGHIPQTTLFYFDFPLSTYFGATILQICGLDSLFFLEIFFPLLVMAVFMIGMAAFIYSISHDIRAVSIGLLLLALFGYGAHQFSPVAFAEMLLPFMLIAFGQKKYTLSFILLAFGLVMSNPTTDAFLICTLIVYVIIIKLMTKRVDNRLLAQVAFFTLAFVAWSFFNSPTFMMNQVEVFLKQLINFSIGQGTTEGLVPPAFPLLGISYARRIFVILTGVIAGVLIFIAARAFLKRRKIIDFPSSTLGDMIGPSMMIVGLLLTLLFYVGVPQAPFGTRSISYYCLGIALSAGFISFKSKKILFAAVILITILIVPAFAFTYPQEQYDLVSTSAIQGLSFTGTQVNANPGIVLCPFGQELQSYANYSLWDNINTLSIPYFGAQSYGYNLRTAQYFVYRLDGEYYYYLTGATANDVGTTGVVQASSYMQIYSTVQNSNSYNKIYSSGAYAIFQNCQNPLIS